MNTSYDWGGGGFVSTSADLDRFLRAPDPALLDHNEELVRRHFSQERVLLDVAKLLDDAGWR